MSLVHLVDPPMSLDFLIFFAYSLIIVNNNGGIITH